MDIRYVFAANLRRIRKEKGLSQEKLAELCGLHRTYIGRIEQRRENPSLKNIGIIAEGLEVNPGLLFVDPTNENRSFSTSEKTSAFALCKIDGEAFSIEPLDVEDTNLTVQILTSLIQDGYRDQEDLAKRYEETKRELLSYFHSRNEEADA